jgi:hypothetical protein
MGEQKPEPGEPTGPPPPPKTFQEAFLTLIWPLRLYWKVIIICAIGLGIVILSFTPLISLFKAQQQSPQSDFGNTATPPPSPSLVPFKGSASPTHTYAWSKKSDLYHFASCKYVRQISRANFEEGDTPPPGKTLHAGCPK